MLLVVPPFHTEVRPSIGVSLLKAALARDGVPCDVLYLNLRFAELIGLEFYSELAGEAVTHGALVGDWVFAGDLLGDAVPDPRRYVEDVLIGQYRRFYDDAYIERLWHVREQVPAFLDACMEHVDWQEYAIVGVTSTFSQNCASLALLQRIKAQYPAIHTVMGGGNCEGAMGAAIHELFPCVDYVCSGEGDRVFPMLVSRLLAGAAVVGLPGILARGQPNLMGDDVRAPMVLDMDCLPIPDYDDYFTQLAASAIGPHVQPDVTLETSRGCWWGEKHHCTFCGLNGGGMKYRSKSPERALEEVEYLIDRHGVRDVFVVDNILDMRLLDSFITPLGERGLATSLFYETKANLTKAQLRTLKRAGVRRIQPGIESLSTAILRSMNKGVTGLQNVRLLKWCYEVGVVPMWNILYGFPDEDPAEYAEMAALLPALFHLPPPSAVAPIRLDRFSPNFEQAEARGFANIRAAQPYRYVFPFPLSALDRLAYCFDFDYADGRDPHTYTSALRQEGRAWREALGTAKLDLRVHPDRLEIEDSRPGAVNRLTVLEGPQRLAYLALDAGATVSSVQATLQQAPGSEASDANALQQWLDQWVDARLVMREGPRYLSLATNRAERVRTTASLRGSSARREPTPAPAPSG